MTNEELVIRIKAGIDVADNMLQLWQQVKDFVCSIAKRYAGYEAMDDLMQEGYLSLYDAIDGYDPTAGFLFLTYAKKRIQMRLTRYVYRNKAIRIPEQKRMEIRKYQKVAQGIRTQYGREPSEREICYMLQIDPEYLQELLMLQELSTMSSLDVPVSDGEGGKERSLSETVPSEENVEGDILDRMEQEELRETLWRMVNELPEQQGEVIRMRYKDGMTLKEIGAIIGSDARKVESKGLRELRLPHNANKLRPFLPEAVESRAYHGNSAEVFKRTWTSSTERAAMRLCDTKMILKKYADGSQRSENDKF